MYPYSEIKQVHLELTSYCNASCPQCARNISGGGINPNLPLNELTLEDCKKIFSDTFLKQLDLIFLCGNYGDPLMGSETIEILQYFKAVNPSLTLGIHTNASGRDKDWWEQLAKVVSYCKFSIDGLEDTNHIYRKNTVWKKIMQSVEWYINAGGHADWDYIVFKHNQHQVDEAYKLSQKLGFRKFNVKRTERFYTPSKPLEQFKKEVLNKAEEIEYTIEPPDDPKYIHEANTMLSGFIKNENDFNNYLETTEISCKSVNNKQIYVSAEGLVFPCCYLSNIYRVKPSFNVLQIHKIINTLPDGKKTLNGKIRLTNSILEEDFFTKIIPGTWDKHSFAEGRLYTCARTCGNHQLCANSQTYIPKTKSANS